MINQTKLFYDQLANDYDLIFGDWNSAVRKHGKNLHNLLKSLGYKTSHSILDCTCGTGMQAIGLGLCGYQVQGTDLSSKSIICARKYAKQFNISINFQVADIRKIHQTIKTNFDIVIACGSLPHLLTDNDLKKSLKNIYKLIKPNGLFLASIRDYDLLLKNKPKILSPIIYEKGEKYWLGLEVLNWQKRKSIYELKFFHLIKQTNKWKTICRTAKFRAFRQEEITKYLELDFDNVKWHMPEETGYFQPIVTARRK